jgi:hypothetical protein
MDMALVVIGSIISLIGWIWLVIACFKESILWGIGGLLCGLIAVVYGIMNWGELKIPVLMALGGSVLSTVGQVIK